MTGSKDLEYQARVLLEQADSVAQTASERVYARSWQRKRTAMSILAENECDRESRKAYK